jgi:hypothetical protein
MVINLEDRRSHRTVTRNTRQPLVYNDNYRPPNDPQELSEPSCWPLRLQHWMPHSSTQCTKSKQTIGINKTGCVDLISIVHLTDSPMIGNIASGMALTTQKRTSPTALASKRMHSRPEVSPHRIPSEDTRVLLTGACGRSSRWQTGRSKPRTREG